jgi:hypothetical protein
MFFYQKAASLQNLRNPTNLIAITKHSAVLGLRRKRMKRSCFIEKLVEPCFCSRETIMPGISIQS